MKTALLASLVALPAAAAPSTPFDGGDWTWSLLAGTGGGAALGFAGGVLAAVAVNDGPEDFADLVAGVFIGMPLGADAGATGAVFAYGQLSGHDGSFMATLAGGTVGALVGLGLFLGSVSLSSDLLPLGLFFMAGAPAAGATGGYVLSLEAGPDEAEVAGALLDWAPAHGLRLGVPLVQTAADAEGHFAVGLPLLGGRF